MEIGIFGKYDESHVLSVLGPELFSGWINAAANPFETFDTSLNSINNGINNVGMGLAGFLYPLPVVIGEKFILSCDYHTITGSVYNFGLVNAFAGSFFSTNFVPKEGYNSYILTVTKACSSFYCQVAFVGAGSFYMKNVSLKKVFDN